MDGSHVFLDHVGETTTTVVASYRHAPKLLGDIVSCPGCGQQVHALCTQGVICFRCVCRVCNVCVVRAGLPVEEWVGRVFWYCADRAAVMQSTGNGVCGLMQNLQTEVLGQAVLLPVHANCHRADLAFREAMDGSHIFLDHVGETTIAVVAWYRNAPTRLLNLRRLSQALHISPLQYTFLGQRRWAAFAARAVRAVLRTYPGHKAEATKQQHSVFFLVCVVDWLSC